MRRGVWNGVFALGLLAGAFGSGLVTPDDASAARARPPSRLLQSARNKNKKITMPEKPWVDVNLDRNNGRGNGSGDGADDLSRLLSDAKNRANGNGLGNGGRGNGTAAPPAGGAAAGGSPQIGMDDSQPKDQGNGSYGQGDTGGGGAGGGGGGGGSQAFAKWYPMCLFLGDHVSTAQGNQTVKELVDDSAKCGVNLVVFPITVPTSLIPPSEAIVNQRQIASCNIKEGLGVDHASTSICTQHDRIAGEMCRVPDPTIPNNSGPPWDPNVAGCAQVATGKTGEIEQLVRGTFPGLNAPPTSQAYQEAKRQFDERMADIRKHMGGGQGHGVLPSIEKMGACDGDTVGHEAQGHSQFGYPNGASSGKAIGLSTTGGGGSGWTKEGCDAMFKASYPNDGRWRWNPNQQTYYVKASPERMFQLGTDKVFRPPGPMLVDGAGAPDGGAGGPPRVLFDDGAPKVREVPPPALTGVQPPPAKLGKANTATAYDDERHRPRPQSLLLSGATGGQNTYQATAPGETASTINPQAKLPPGGRGTPSSKVGYDDEAPKGLASYSTKASASAPPKAEAPPGGLVGPVEASTETSTFATTSSATVSSGAGGKGKGIGYDDEAPKNFSGNGSSINLGGRGPASAGGRPLEENVSGSSAGPKILAGGASSPSGGNQLDPTFFKAVSGDDELEEVELRKKRQPGGTLRLRPGEGAGRGNREPRRAASERSREEP